MVAADLRQGQLGERERDRKKGVWRAHPHDAILASRQRRVRRYAPSAFRGGSDRGLNRGSPCHDGVRRGRPSGLGVGAPPEPWLVPGQGNGGNAQICALRAGPRHVHGNARVDLEPPERHAGRSRRDCAWGLRMADAGQALGRARLGPADGSLRDPHAHGAQKEGAK